MRQYIRFIASFATACLAMVQFQASADQVINDDLIVSGSICVGFDCANGEVFGYDTIRLKENNVRIKFQDTSASSSFPSGDWEITANDSSNGGANYLAIADVTSSTVPFKISQGNKTNAFFMAQSTGYIGIGTATPGVHVEIKSGNSPAIRLNQDNTGGFAAQSWDIAGNETNFFIRDITNAGKLPLRITAGAPSGAIFVASDGDVGFETITPDGLFDIAHPVDANNHAVLVSPTANFGINIDNGFNPRFLFDVQTTNGTSLFSVSNTGKVGLGLSTAGTPNGVFDIQSAGVTKFIVDNSYKVGIGTSAPAGVFDVTSSTNQKIFLASNDGRISSTSDYFDGNAATCGGANSSISLACGRFTPFFALEETNAQTQGRMMMSIKANQPSWFGFEDTTQNKLWYLTNAANAFTFVLYDKTTNEITEKLKVENNGNVIATGTVSGGSSRYIKDNIIPVDVHHILSLVDSLEISKWTYKADSPDITHIGPMSQDFYALFNIGIDNEHISSMDTSGVSLAAIKALHEKVKALQQELSKIKSDSTN